MNSEGDTATAKEAVKINAGLDKNIIDNMAHDKWKMKKLIKFGLEESSTPIVKNPTMKRALEQKTIRRVNSKKPIQKIDVGSISKGISEYLALTKKEKPIKRPEFLNKKFRDPDMDKGIVSVFGGYPNPKKII